MGYMKTVVCAPLLALFSLTVGCSAVPDNWPSRSNRTPSELLVDTIRWQQRQGVRESVGELAYECFTDVDLEEFVRDKRPQQVAAHVKTMHEFQEIALALRSLSPEDRESALREARSIARPTWSMMGYIDRSGRGQTEAGHKAELMIAGAVVDAFANEITTR